MFENLIVIFENYIFSFEGLSLNYNSETKQEKNSSFRRDKKLLCFWVSRRALLNINHKKPVIALSKNQVK